MYTRFFGRFFKSAHDVISRIFGALSAAGIWFFALSPRSHTRKDFTVTCRLLKTTPFTKGVYLWVVV